MNSKIRNILIVAFVVLLSFASQASWLSFNDPLVDAADQGNSKKLVQLLKDGYPVDSMGDFNVTPLMRASFKNHVDIVEVLLKLGAYPDLTDIGGETALHLAVKNKNLDVVKLLVKYDANVNAVDKENWTPLMRAILSNSEDISLYLIEYGADLSIKNNFDETVLIHAVDMQLLDVVKKIIQSNGYNKFTKDEIDYAKLIAKKKDNSQIYQLLNSSSNKILTEKDLTNKNMVTPFSPNTSSGNKNNNNLNKQESTSFNNNQDKFLSSSHRIKLGKIDTSLPWKKYKEEPIEEPIEEKKITKTLPKKPEIDMPVVKYVDVPRKADLQKKREQEILDKMNNRQVIQKEIEPLKSDKPSVTSKSINLASANSSSSNLFYIQVGTFINNERALFAWKILRKNHPDIFSNINYQIKKVFIAINKRNLFRLRVGPYSTRSSADNICNILRDRQVQCFVVEVAHKPNQIMNAKSEDSNMPYDMANTKIQKQDLKDSVPNIENNIKEEDKLEHVDSSPLKLQQIATSSVNDAAPITNEKSEDPILMKNNDMLALKSNIVKSDNSEAFKQVYNRKNGFAFGENDSKLPWRKGKILKSVYSLNDLARQSQRKLAKSENKDKKQNTTVESKEKLNDKNKKIANKLENKKEKNPKFKDSFSYAEMKNKEELEMVKNMKQSFYITNSSKNNIDANKSAMLTNDNILKDGSKYIRDEILPWKVSKEEKNKELPWKTGSNLAENNSDINMKNVKDEVLKLSRQDIINKNKKSNFDKEYYQKFYDKYEDEIKNIKGDLSEAIPVSDNVYFANKDNISGNNANDGSSDLRWLVIGSFANNMQANDFWERMFKYNESYNNLNMQIIRDGNSSEFKIGPITNFNQEEAICNIVKNNGLRCKEYENAVGMAANDNLGNIDQDEQTYNMVMNDAYWINLGAFANKDEAEYYWMFLREDNDDLIGNLNHNMVNIPRHEAFGENATKLVVGPFSKQNRADKICSIMRYRNVACLVSR